MPWGSGTHRFLPSLTWQCDPRVAKLMDDCRPGAVIVDLGAGGRRIAPEVLAVDFVSMPGTDIVADASLSPFADGSVDLVISTGFLEHVESEDKLLAEIRRILRPGGRVHIEVPFLQQYHEDPIDCRRFTLPGLKLFLERYGLKPVLSGVHIGPSVTIITLLAHYAALIFEGPSFVQRATAHAAFMGVSVLLLPMKFLDRLVGRKAGAHRLAFGIYCTAEKIA